MSITLDGTKGGTSSAGWYAQGAFTGTYTDGIVVDYATGNGRISVGSADGLTIYNGGVASTALLSLSSSGNITMSGSNTISAPASSTLTLNGGAGSNGLVLDASNNVGIGTSSPDATLVLNNATASQLSMKYNSSLLGWLYAGSAGFYVASTNFTGFSVGGNERMRLDSSGNLGIGTNSPLAKLQVKSTNPQIWMEDSAAGTNGKFTAIGTSNGTMTFSRYLDNGSLVAQYMTLDASGNLGLGYLASSPVTTLTVTSGAGSQKRAVYISSGDGSGTAGGIYMTSATSSGGNGATIEAIGQRSDANGSSIFSGNALLGHLRTDAAISTANTSLGRVGFGGNPTGTALSNILYSAQIVGISDGVWSSSSAMPTALAFYTGSTGVNVNASNSEFGTERARIDSSGNLLVGTTSIGYIGSEALTLSRNSGTTKWSVGPYTGQPGQFYVASAAGTGVYINGTSATAWSSNSDERLKTDLKPIENATGKVASLRAVTGRYKTDEEGFSRAFLIAQDVQAVLPEAVGLTRLPGTEDETEYLSLAYTDTIPLLVAAIKELTARLEALENK